MCANGPICAQKRPGVFHMYRREHRHQLSFEDFFLPFGGKLSGDNRWIKLAEPCRVSILALGVLD